MYSGLAAAGSGELRLKVAGKLKNKAEQGRRHFAAFDRDQYPAWVPLRVSPNSANNLRSTNLYQCAPTDPPNSEETQRLYLRLHSVL